jgi:hypothetical protein
MTRERMAVLGLVGFTWLAVGCSGSGGTSNPAPSTPQDQELRNYLADGGPMYLWEEKISKAVCNLENNVTGLPLTDAYCGGHPWPPSDTPPPKFPPN